MHSISKVFGPFLIAGALMASAQAETAPVREQLDAALYKDGVQIVTGTSVIGNNGKAPFVISNGENIAYGHCTKDGNTTTLRSESAFVGRALFIAPAMVDGNKAMVSVSVQDTEFVGKSEDGPADCRSEVVNTKGLIVEKRNVVVADGQTIDVPLGDAHYRLALKLHHADL
ncbi:hypothetical protein [Paraburkholderia atlantica]|uniref:hypothetical protein n=2 Tax=Burkholderiaceae TaxID=119060 RepID=UPI0016140898|nr:hypothetical protein [Paraburkholderia atlantica]MBB5420709.1 hypothetical protein [Paraburkholderia atlantica]